jgi:hypothetical protein
MQFVNKIVRSDEDSLKIKGTLNHHSFLYRSPENPHIPEEKTLN